MKCAGDLGDPLALTIGRANQAWIWGPEEVLPKSLHVDRLRAIDGPRSNEKYARRAPLDGEVQRPPRPADDDVEGLERARWISWNDCVCGGVDDMSDGPRWQLKTPHLALDNAESSFRGKPRPIPNKDSWSTAQRNDCQAEPQYAVCVKQRLEQPSPYEPRGASNQDPAAPEEGPRGTPFLEDMFQVDGADSHEMAFIFLRYDTE